jgi:hypothetical protein
MNESPRHELDAAIDRVAARMVAAPEDPMLLSRTLAQLPERQVTPWFMTVRVQVAAAAAVLLAAFVFARPAQEPALIDAARAVTASPVPWIPDARIPDPGSRIPAASPAVQAVVPRLPTRDSRLPASIREDHERSLTPVDAIDALELVGIAPLAMELEATPAPVPLVVTELALDPKGDL